MTTAHGSRRVVRLAGSAGGGRWLVLKTNKKARTGRANRWFVSVRWLALRRYIESIGQRFASQNAKFRRVVIPHELRFVVAINRPTLVIFPRHPIGERVQCGVVVVIQPAWVIID